MPPTYFLTMKTKIKKTKIKRCQKIKNVLTHNDEHTMLTVMEVHDLLLLNYYVSVHPRTIQKWALEKPFCIGVKIGNETFIEKDVLIQFFTNRVKGENYENTEKELEIVTKDNTFRTRAKTRTVKVPKINKK